MLTAHFIICSYKYNFRERYKCHFNFLSVLVKKFPEWYENGSRWQGLASLVRHHDMAVLIISSPEYNFWYGTGEAPPLHGKLQAWVKAALCITLRGDLGEELVVLLLINTPTPPNCMTCLSSISNLFLKLYAAPQSYDNNSK